MALKKPTPSAANLPADNKFEDGEAATTTTTTSAPAAEPAAQAKPDAAAASVEATTAVAKAAAGALQNADEAAARAKRFQKDVEAMKGAADFSWGTHRVFKAKDGVIKEMNGEKLRLGRWALVQMLAWDNHTEISPGEDGKSSSDFVAYSKDGVTIDFVVGEELKKFEGTSVDDYVRYLRDEEEFEKAGKREFVDVQVAVLDSEDEHDFHEIVQVTLSSSSIPAFKKYQNDLNAKAKCVAMGLPGYSVPENPFQFYFIREEAEKGKNSWTKLRISSTLPAKF